MARVGARWCDTLTLAGSRYPQRAASLASVRIVREAHRLMAEGMSVEEAARATIARTRYSDVNGYVSALRECWSLLGLPSRSRSCAQSLRSLGANAAAPPPPRRRLDVSTAELAAHYAESRSTTATAAAFRMSQQGVYLRLKPLGIVPARPGVA